MQQLESEVVLDDGLLSLEPSSIALNEDDAILFVRAGFISPQQYQALIDHISNYGPILHVNELQSIDGWDLRTIRRIRPLVYITAGNIGPRKEFFKNGQHTLQVYGLHPLQQAAGFATQPNETEAPFSGSNVRNYIKYKFRYYQLFKIGITLESDPGERNPIFSKGWFDHSSWYIAHSSSNHRLSNIVLGDYHINMGQGLITHSGFGGGIGIAPISMKKGGKTIRAHTGNAESGFKRGLALQYDIFKRLQLALFYARTREDATIYSDSSSNEKFIRTINTSGLHRTSTELLRKNSLLVKSYGGVLSYSTRSLKINLNNQINSFNVAFKPAALPHSLHRIKGRLLIQTSLSYSGNIRNAHLFGEWAYSNNGGTAFLHSCLISIGKASDIALSIRHYSPKYQTLGIRTFSQNTSTQNEQGLYMSVHSRISRQFSMGVFFDMWRHSWLRYNIDSPSHGYESGIQLAYSLKRRLEIRLRLNQRVRLQNTHTDYAYAQLNPVSQNIARLRLNYHIDKGIEWRNRINYNSTRHNNGKTTEGWLILQDFIYKPMASKLTFTARLALFNTQDWSTRLYAYENNLLGNFSIPAYAYKGTRFYINLRYKAAPNLTLELRYANRMYSNDRTLDVSTNRFRVLTNGNGNDELPGLQRSEIGWQLKWKI